MSEVEESTPVVNGTCPSPTVKEEKVDTADIKPEVKKSPFDALTSEEIEKLREVANKLWEEGIGLTDEETGLPSAIRESREVIIGKYVPITKRNMADLDITAEDAIMDCPSQVVPLLIKKPNLWPPKMEEDNKKRVTFQDQVKPKKRPLPDDDDEKDEDYDVEEDPEVKLRREEKKKEIEKEKEKAKANTMLTIDDYYGSKVGQTLLSIGLSRVTESYHRDVIRSLRRQIHKEGELYEYTEEMDRQTVKYKSVKAINAIFVGKTSRCHMCDFRFESEVALDLHLQVPHLTPKKEYRCNFCPFLTRDPNLIVSHFDESHRKTCIVEPPPTLYECPMCPYESSQKQKATGHIAKCTKFFNPDTVQLVPDPESDHPALTPKPIGQKDIEMYEKTLSILRLVAQNPGTPIPETIASFGIPLGVVAQMLHVTQAQLQQQAKMRQQKRAAAAAAAAAAAPPQGRGHLGQNGNRPPPPTGGQAPNLYNMLQSAGSGKKTSQPTGSRPQVQSQAGLTSHMVAMQQQQLQQQKIIRAQQGNKMPPGDLGSFVICEICDGYIKDLDTLRTHMQWTHKVKIHPKMLSSRPPLNCQKCQWRFFTDQGLERHLLGAHGLVTINMQECAAAQADGGRCTICGQNFPKQLVNHMSQVHKVTLKPAQLSYKCTVCSCTFNLYRLFEAHVYEVHQGQGKRGTSSSQGDGPPNKKGKIMSENNPANNGVASYSSILKRQALRDEPLEVDFIKSNGLPVPVGQMIPNPTITPPTDNIESTIHEDGNVTTDVNMESTPAPQEERETGAGDNEPNVVTAPIPVPPPEPQMVETGPYTKKCLICNESLPLDKYPDHVKDHLNKCSVSFPRFEKDVTLMKQHEGLILNRQDTFDPEMMDEEEVPKRDRNPMKTEQEKVISGLNEEYETNPLNMVLFRKRKVNTSFLVRPGLRRPPISSSVVNKVQPALNHPVIEL